MQQSAVPTPTPLPSRPPEPAPPRESSSSTESSYKHKVKLLLEVRDISCKAGQDFLKAIGAGSVIEEYVRVIRNMLYESGYGGPPTRSVTVIVRAMGGVAYTTGKDFDEDHKEIHLSLDYIDSVSRDQRSLEIIGVLVHELVHCFQWNAIDTAPMGLIEGIADWVRLSCGLAPPHWKRAADGKWDAGYQHTGYFLDYLEGRYGYGTVRKINGRLRTKKYEEGKFWTEIFHEGVHQLWDDYRQWLEKQPADKDGEADHQATESLAIEDDAQKALDGRESKSEERGKPKATPTTLSGGEGSEPRTPE